MKYYAVIKRWERTRARQFTFIGGIFDNIVNASIAFDALSDNYDDEMEIISIAKWKLLLLMIVNRM